MFMASVDQLVVEVVSFDCCVGRGWWRDQYFCVMLCWFCL